MRGELQPITPEGERFVALAEEHAADFATRAAEHDREGSFPFENFDAMKKSGFIAGLVPKEFGGLGIGIGARPGGWPIAAGARRRFDGDRREHAPRHVVDDGADAVARPRRSSR